MDCKLSVKTQSECNSALRAHLLQLAVFVMNTCVNEHGPIPMLLVLGMHPRLPDLPGSESLRQNEHVKAFRAARADFPQVFAEHWIKLGLRSQVPTLADMFEKGDSVYVNIEMMFWA